MLRQFVKLLRFWWTFDGVVDRRTYLACGVGLAALKYAGDVALVALATGRLWTPNDYLHSLTSLFATTLAGAPPWLMPAMGLWTIPFLWTGQTLTLRRAVNAGYSPWWALGFFVPWLGYLLMAVLCVVPSAPSAEKRARAAALEGKKLPAALVSIGAGAAVGLAMVAFGVLFVNRYGVGLFLGAPFMMGALTAFLFNRRYAATRRESVEVTLMMFAIVSGAAFVLAAEGAACIVMALPLVLAIGLLGAATGRAIALSGRDELYPALYALLALPVATALEPAESTGRVLHEVRTAVEIEAAPDAVWPHVIAFQPIPAPTELVFRLGVSYPRYARISGAGVGAVRYCVFSTGAFVEPITHWEPGRRLGFDVVSSPAPLRELSPYANISPPHLDAYLRSRRGEFRLVALSANRTRLEGSTWYEVEMAPEAYWQLYSDYLIHRVHLRVLSHIKREVERAR